MSVYEASLYDCPGAVGIGEPGFPGESMTAVDKATGVPSGPIMICGLSLLQNEKFFTYVVPFGAVITNGTSSWAAAQPPRSFDGNPTATRQVPAAPVGEK